MMNHFIVDGHSDVLLNYLRDGNYNFKKKTKFQVDLPKMEKANLLLEVFAVCPALAGDQALKKSIKLIDKFNYLLENTEKIELVRTYKQINNIIGI